MAEITGPTQGILKISNVQGNYLAVPLVFTDEDDQPIDLTQFQTIRLEIKELYNVNIPAFIAMEVGTGLVISGANNNLLTFELNKDFWAKQVKEWVFDITFQRDGKALTFIKGTITNDLTAGKV